MKVWALYSARADMHHPHELVALFASQELAETVMANLWGKPVDPRRSRTFDPWPVVWTDDEDFPDLHVGSLEVHG